ncbi:MAG: sigma 54-interacting transcriptional regulator [Deltaproteobacteria bacterium]|nr:sigma 54-interacting transcriptional regulator [Deltaproteobacteria bacterium]
MNPNPAALNLAQIKEAAYLERDLAHKALSDGDLELAWLRQKQVLTRLSSCPADRGCDDLLVSITLEFSNLCFALGKGFTDSAPNLKTAKTAAERLGDRRSRALIIMHLGRFYYFAHRRHEALALFAEGKTEVEDLGDEDILSRSAEFLGFYYHIQGLFNDALPHFERAAQIYESGGKGMALNPSGPIWLAYCYAYLGRFHQAIGTLDYYRRLALERSDRSLATTIRAVLGIVLLMIKKKEEAFQHLNGAWQEAIKTKNDLAYYFALGNLSHCQLMDGHPHEAWETLSKNIKHGKTAGLIRQYASPLALEHLYEFNRLGMKPIPDLSYHQEIERHLQEPNIHLRGVAHRLRAMDAAAREESHNFIEAELQASEELLCRSGDSIQLAKTRLELARLKLKVNQKEKARAYAQKAWYGFSGYGDVFFPDDLRHLLTVHPSGQVNQENSEELTEKFVSMIQELAPSADLDILMARAVAATNRFFGAERGGLFWFNREKSKEKPVFRGSYNLTQSEVFSEAFKSNLALIAKSFREKQPHVARLEGVGYWPHKVRAILCLPLEIAGQTGGVLYHDNSYVKDCFDFLEKPMLTRLGSSLSIFINRLYEFSQRLEQSATEKIHLDQYPDGLNIVAESKVMKKILGQVDRVASSDSTILILGETGVGKELLAQRIHQMSRRNEGPFVIVDPTSIPENLVESELFGHEKGAFTGAERRKAGRLELAHSGTLFIDEIGEIPKSVQVKLLRVLQEKTLVRLGGTQTISSDFRLVVATNRDLAVEVTAGRFREDLYYRLNVVPITLPPLRERLEDVPLLARHFLMKYSAKSKRPLYELTSEDEGRLIDYHWPGNIRELQNIIERAVILSHDETLELDLPAGKKTNSGQFYNGQPSLDELQRRYIKYTLERTGGKIGGRGGAAEFLGMKRTTLQKRINKLGLS